MYCPTWSQLDCKHCGPFLGNRSRQFSLLLHRDKKVMLLHYPSFDGMFSWLGCWITPPWRPFSFSSWMMPSFLSRYDSFPVRCIVPFMVSISTNDLLVISGDWLERFILCDVLEIMSTNPTITLSCSYLLYHTEASFSLSSSELLGKIFLTGIYVFALLTPPLRQNPCCPRQ